MIHHCMMLAQVAMAMADKDADRAPSLLWVTRCMQSVGACSSRATAGLWSRARAARLEERGLRLRCLERDASQGGANEIAQALSYWPGVMTGSAAVEAGV